MHFGVHSESYTEYKLGTSCARHTTRCKLSSKNVFFFLVAQKIERKNRCKRHHWRKLSGKKKRWRREKIDEIFTAFAASSITWYWQKNTFFLSHHPDNVHFHFSLLGIIITFPLLSFSFAPLGLRDFDCKWANFRCASLKLKLYGTVLYGALQ